MDKPQLQRQIFNTSRQLEFFTEKELTMQIGQEKEKWAIALIKELIDNSLDACEKSNKAPNINISINKNSFSVADNGSGIPEEVIKNSINYSLRTSDKSYYISPTRGQLGNAFKCLYAFQYVLEGLGKVEIETFGKKYTINISLDRIKQQPVISLAQSLCARSEGTKITVFYENSSGLLQEYKSNDFYKNSTPLISLIKNFAVFNPHANFVIQGEKFNAKDTKWSKWNPSNPTSIHWYSFEQFSSLIAAYLSANNDKTVREFISEFRGLSGTQKQKTITDETGLHGKLSDFILNGDISRDKAEELFFAIIRESQPTTPSNLGIIGKEHLVSCMDEYYNVEKNTINYKRICGYDNGLPYVLEIALGIKKKSNETELGEFICGLNWTPTINIPISNYQRLLGEMRIDGNDPVCVVLHIARPKFDFVDRGKGTINISDNIYSSIRELIEKISKQWKKQKLHRERIDRKTLEYLRQAYQRESYKEASFAVMDEAIRKASGNGRFLANARQIMYAARPLVLKITNGELWKDSAYFTQNILKDYIQQNEDNPLIEKIVWDARGHLTEPFTHRVIPLGGAAVKEYIDNWTYQFDQYEFPEQQKRIKTTGPQFRFKNVIFIEKEGFDEILRSSEIAEKYDLAFMSTKGIPVEAACQLAWRFNLDFIRVFVLHDFDYAGFKIVKTLRNGTRLSPGTPVDDLGLRLEDIKDLQSERVIYPQKTDPRIYLKTCGATELEQNYLVKERESYKLWAGERVELNALTSDQLILWLENKLKEKHVEKVVPDDSTLKVAYRKASFQIYLQKEMDSLLKKFIEKDIDIPNLLPKQVKEILKTKPTLSWDDAVWEVAERKTHVK